MNYALGTKLTFGFIICLIFTLINAFLYRIIDWKILGPNACLIDAILIFLFMVLITVSWQHTKPYDGGPKTKGGGN